VVAAPAPAPAPAAAPTSTPVSVLKSLPSNASALAKKLASECDQGKARRCLGLGLLYEHDDRGVPKDLERARALFQRACESPDAVGCARVAPEDPTTIDEALRARLEKGCRDGQLDACRALVAADGPDPGGEPTGERLRHLRATCSAGGVEACAAVMTEDATPLPEGVPTALAELGVAPAEFQALARRCDAGQAVQCLELAKAYASDALPVDPARAKRLAARACNDDTTVGCVLVGDLRIPGDATAVTGDDLSAAIAYYQRACEHFTLDGCARLAGLFEKTKKPPALVEAAALYQEACAGPRPRPTDAPDPDACAGVARLVVVGKRP
ncbi:MAG: hypothetical protein EP329_14745, partial [Deltaproteobacteria bacterium]